MSNELVKEIGRRLADTYGSKLDTPHQLDLDKDCVLSLHGILTTGKWQKDLNKNLQFKSQKFNHIPLDYGFFGPISLLIPWTRRKKIDWFRNEYQSNSQYFKNKPPSIVAHSFGSYIVARSMEVYPEISFNKIILCGTFLNINYSWEIRKSNKQFNEALHLVGKLDIWAKIASWVINDGGSSGTDGFSSSYIKNIVYPEFRHSDFFYDLNYDSIWIPFLEDKEFAKPIMEKRHINARYRMLKFGLLAIILVFGFWLYFF